MTRFGEISTLWQNVPVLGSFWFGIWQIFVPSTANLCYRANFQWYKRQKIEKLFNHFFTLAVSNMCHVNEPYSMSFKYPLKHCTLIQRPLLSTHIAITVLMEKRSGRRHRPRHVLGVPHHRRWPRLVPDDCLRLRRHWLWAQNLSRDRTEPRNLRRVRERDEVIVEPRWRPFNQGEVVFAAVEVQRWRRLSE